MNGISGILVLIISLAIVAVLVSRGSQTANFITTAGNAFDNVIKTAVGPIS